MAVLLLVACSLALMGMRIWLPRGATVTGRPIGELRLTWRERIALQRSNLYGFGVILLLVTATGMVPLLYELIAFAVVYGILTVPVRYRLTSDGIALNNVVFRRWDEFQRVNAEQRAVRLVGVAGMRDFQVVAQGEHQAAALALIQQRLPNGPARRDQKGGAPMRGRAAWRGAANR